MSDTDKTRPGQSYRGQRSLQKEGRELLHFFRFLIPHKTERQSAEAGSKTPEQPFLEPTGGEPCISTFCVDFHRLESQTERPNWRREDALGHPCGRTRVRWFGRSLHSRRADSLQQAAR